MTVREAARRYLESILESEWSGEEALSAVIDELGPEDRGLFQELTQGTLREWLFLSWAVSRHASRAPRGTLLIVLNLSAYQLLFLDRIPEYAIFSEAAALSSGLGLSEPELKFVHGVLKSVQREKAKLLDIRNGSLERSLEGRAPESELEWAVLNIKPEFVDALTVVEDKGKKKEARSRAVKAVATMKERAKLIGYALPGANVRSVTASLFSQVAPRALILKPGPELTDDFQRRAIRVQGEASQWACELAAGELAQAAAKGRPLKVLEMTSGKGGKLVGTLSALTAQLGGDPRRVPEMEWLAADADRHQLGFLELDAVPLVKAHWPQVRVIVHKSDWSEPPTSWFSGIGFDLIWLDAPCTGFGTLAKLPEIALKRGLNAYAEALKLAAIQQALCLRGFELAQRNGAFFYTVCTMTRPETLGIIEFCAEKTGRAPRHYQALWPGSQPAPTAEGFFAALY